MSILILLAGLALIIGGAHFLTEGASSVAKRWGVPPLVIGLTVVAFGTSAPELVVSITSAIKGSGDIALGNVVGSNILNILLIGGLTAVIAPLTISRSTLRYEIPMCIAVSLLLVLLIVGIPGIGIADRQVDRLDGIVLIACFLLFLAYNLVIARRGKNKETEADEIKTYKTWLSAVFIVGGLAALIYGGDLFVTSASSLARAMGISESIIGLTIVALGTSLPELATSLVAALKKRHDLAIGNIIGSNIFNVTAILGISATVRPMQIKGIDFLDYAAFVGSSVVILLFGYFIGTRKLKRGEGLVMLILMGGYLMLRIGQAS